VAVKGLLQMRSKPNASDSKRGVSKAKDGQRCFTSKGPITRLQEVERGLQVQYGEIPYKRMQFKYVDTFNNECLHQLIMDNANYATKEEVKTAYGIFLMQLKEMW
jgi:hypothetical protein